MPRGVPEGNFGPRLQAILGYLTGCARMSKRVIGQTVQDLFSLRISLGAIQTTQERVSGALAGPVQEAKEYARRQKAAHVDETGWKEGNKPKAKAKAWLWVMVTAWVTIFVIHRKRGLDGLWATVRMFQGYLISDRWFAYEAWSTFKRQLCWAHLLRHFQAFVDSGLKKPRAVGEKLLFESKRMFALWHRVRDGTLSRRKFQAQLRPIRRAIHRLLKRGTRCGYHKTRVTCEDLLRLWPALWTFARVRGIEPTNNAAERALRPAVVYRKCSYGTNSAAGSRFIERILTVVATLRQQERNVLEFLTRVCNAENLGHRKPSLLPTVRIMRAAAA